MDDALPGPVPATRAPLVPREHQRVIVAVTARSNGLGARRLPDRQDHEGPIAAVQVESAEDAIWALTELDQVGRVIYVDVEAKQAMRLWDLARSVVRCAEVRTVKPNDSTVDAVEALVLNLRGLDLSVEDCAVFGTGNLAFKIALRLAERGARVQIHGRDDERVRGTVQQLNAILPRYADRPATGPSEVPVNMLVTAVTAAAVVGPEWLPRLAQAALVVDVGIDNLDAAFIAEAQERGHTCLRLDTRAAPYPVAPQHSHFFEVVLGRADVQGLRVVAGGVIGRLGEIVVDQVVGPTRVIGVANGTGGLIPSTEWSSDHRKGVETVEEHIRQAGP